jgi:hypothetical protein
MGSNQSLPSFVEKEIAYSIPRRFAFPTIPVEPVHSRVVRPFINKENRHYQPWSDEEDNTLFENMKTMTLEQMAKVHGRSKKAIQMRINSIYPSYYEKYKTYRGLKMTTLYNMNCIGLTHKERVSIVEFAISHDTLLFQSEHKYDFTQPIDVKIIWGSNVSFVKDMNITVVRQLFKSPLTRIYLQPNV